MKRSYVVLCLAVALGIMAAAPRAQALVPDGTQGWFWQMPQPAGGLNDLAFRDASHVWAVGGGGLILHSSDAGATWAAQSAPTSADLWSVSFPDDQHGWVCGDQTAAGLSPGVILATSDGGATWVDKTPTGLKESLTNASFVDGSHGWIGTTDGDILKTSNGGVTWQHLKLASTYQGYLAGYLFVDLVDASHGWAGGAGGQMWRTADGGKTWMSLRSGLTSHMLVIQLDFVDRSHGWVLAFSLDSGTSQLVTTSDGGVRWHTVSTGDPWVSYLDATSASSAWLLSGGLWNSVASGVRPVIAYHTTDGGAHWRTSLLGSPAPVSAIAGNGNAVCAVGDGILTSSDVGASWQSATSGQQYQFTAATAFSATDIWAVDATGALLHSVDGSHWAEQSTPVRGASVLYGVSFPSQNDGWVVGASDAYGDGSVILHTSDGGVSWSPQASNLSGELVGVDFVDALNGWAISDDNSGFGGSGAPLTVEHTTDGGLTWVPQYVYGNASLFAVDFVSDTAGWAAGVNDSGLPGIFASTNGGVTWSTEKLPSGAPALTGLQFLNPNDGWAVGTSYDQYDEPQQGWVLRTTDGGKTWTRLAGLNDSLAMTVHFSDAQDGWLGGLNGVYTTTDGGTTWQHAAGGYGVEAIAASDPQHTWAFGDGFLASTLDAGVDTAAPMTLVDNFNAWYHKTATISLSASDVGGSGVQSTDYSTDGGTTWQPGTSVTVDAPADHANDGEHTILYRSTDKAGNQEQTESVNVGIDTLGPVCSAPRRSVVDAGKLGTLYFMACDATSDVAQATISILDSHGHVLRRFVEHAGNWAWWPARPYYWLRFKCALKPGTYRVEVRATDWAGNPQVVIGRNVLRVVRRGAPAFHSPGWPAGLPFTSTGFSSFRSHGARMQRLLRSRASLPGPWWAPLLSETGKLR